MVKSKAKECTPWGTIHLVKWSTTKTTRGFKSRWVPDKCKNGNKSLQSSPTKSPTKQPSDGLVYSLSEDFDGGFYDHGSIKPMHLPKRLKKRQWQTPNEYLQQWKIRTWEYLDILIQRKAPPPDWVCCLCNGDGAQKCHDCFAEPMSCTRCCWTEHAQQPFHRVSQWNGEFFERTTLTKLGVEIHLGHEGKPCPHDCWDWEDTDDEWQPGASSTVGTPGAGDTDGCEPPAALYGEVLEDCEDLGDTDVFVEPGSPVTADGSSYPAATPTDNLKCGTSAMNYYSKLRRITSSVFPHLVPDRYRELMRVVRQWQQLKLLKLNGFGHKWREPKDGELALFCPACPQPGINVTIPTEDRADTPGWLYSRSLVMDGNFKAEHLHPTHLEDEVWLTNGQSFMVARARYQAHLALAKDLAQRNRGVRMRPGWVLCSKFDGGFSKRGMMNMDYMLCNALGHNMEGLHQAFTFYDVNCQYHKHLQWQVDESLHLTIPSGMEIIPGIGLWHVHGHQEKCFVQYTSNFIPGAARIDGEIMETLWASLNIISPSARGMSTPHRQECLDYQMNDCNFMKMIRMGLFLSWKYKEAKQGVAKSSQAFDTLNDAADPDIVDAWEAQEKEAQESRIDDPSSLDIYDVQLNKGGSREIYNIRKTHDPGRRSN
ncbi:hypothetical protein F4604DRAFT_1677024 [Suillus subluteus]|nr:hypothetical protein F4604DRAFT_1677024 [Suillus subluteus]